MLKTWNMKTISSGGLLMAAMMVANVCNFLFNTFLGRVLSFEEFGLVVLVNTLWQLVAVLFYSLAGAVSHRSAYLAAKYGHGAANDFLVSTLKYSRYFSIALVAVWVILIPFLSQYFHTPSYLPLLMFAPTLLIGAAAFSRRGWLNGNFLFSHLAVIEVVEALIKLLGAAALVAAGYGTIAYISIPLSLVGSAGVTWWLVRSNLVRSKEINHYRFPKRFFLASILTGMSTSAFLSIDVIWAKHFLSLSEAGQYALLSLIGKMIFFLGSLANTFMISFVSRDEGAKKDPNVTFYRLFVGTAVLVSGAWMALGPFGHLFVPMLWGERAQAIVPYLSTYAFAIVLFTLSSSIVLYHLTRHHYLFSMLGTAMTVLMSIGIWLFHNNIADITQVILVVSWFSLLVMVGFHYLQDNGQFVLRNLVDLMEAFLPLSQPAAKRLAVKNILIFNWRDTKHKYAGGAEVYIHELAKRWAEAGHQVTLFCGNDGKSQRNEMIDGVQIVRRGGFWFVYAWAFVYYLTQFRGKYDLIIDCNSALPFFTPFYAKEKIYCVMHHVHQEVFHRYLPKPLAMLAAVLENRLMPWAYKNIQFVSVSESTKQEMLRLGIDEKYIQIVHNGVDLDLLQPGEKNERPTILYLGRLKAYKSIDVLIRAFKTIVQEIPTVELVIAGGGDEESNLKKLAHELGVSNQITFTGKITEDEKLNWLQKAWVFVNPSCMEGWGITTIEANACGTPVVASNVPGLRDSVKNPHTGFLVTYGDEKALSQKIELLLTDKKLRTKMSWYARKWAGKFDWQTSADKFMKMFA